MASIINSTTTAGVTVTGDNSGSLQLATNNGTTALTIDTSQNVTASTSITTPTATINNAGASTVLTIGGDTASTVPEIRFKQNSATRYNFQIGIGTQVNDAFTVTPSTAIGGTTFTTPAMVVNSSGKVLIGSTSLGSANLNSVGDSGIRPQINIYNTDTGSVTQGLMEFFRNAVFTGGIQNTGTTTLYNTSSDYRLKENISPMTGALAKVQQLKPCTYTWKLNGSAGQGFIAHELQAVVPDCVTGEKDAIETYTDEDGNEQTRIRPQGIDTSFLVATLTAAIQELKAELDATKAEVQALKGVA